MNGAIIYEGPSLIDGFTPIAAIATNLKRPSKNPKTGRMIQVWIVRTDCPPNVAARDGRDEAVCGNCVLRMDQNGVRKCYVVLHQAPLAVYKAYLRGAYHREDPMVVGANRTVRLGAYGDPAAVPFSVWEKLLSQASGYTGYTHQRNHKSPIVRNNAYQLRKWCMASVDSVNDAVAAHNEGWRTFRVIPPNSGPFLQNERICPASEEAGKLTTCEACQACSGVAGRGRSSIVIQPHGRNAHKFAA